MNNTADVTHLAVYSSVSSITWYSPLDRWRLRRQIRRWIRFSRRTLGMHFDDLRPHLEVVIGSGIATAQELIEWYPAD